jgi:hypothetical protein
MDHKWHVVTLYPSDDRIVGKCVRRFTECGIMCVTLQKWQTLSKEEANWFWSTLLIISFKKLS